MRPTWGAVAAFAVVLGLVLGATPLLGAGPAAVIADFRADARIDDGHGVADLQAALRAAASGTEMPGFAAAVQEELDEMLLGRSGGDADPDAGKEPQAAGGVGEAELRLTEVDPEAPPVLSLPEPSGPGETHPPWALVALAAAGGVLAMCGLASAVYRRLRRPAQPAR
jgi:hypothetical protein